MNLKDGRSSSRGAHSITSIITRFSSVKHQVHSYLRPYNFLVDCITIFLPMFRASSACISIWASLIRPIANDHPLSRLTYLHPWTGLPATLTVRGHLRRLSRRRVAEAQQVQIEKGEAHIWTLIGETRMVARGCLRLDNGSSLHGPTC